MARSHRLVAGGTAAGLVALGLLTTIAWAGPAAAAPPAPQHAALARDAGLLPPIPVPIPPLPIPLPEVPPVTVPDLGASGSSVAGTIDRALGALAAAASVPTVPSITAPAPAARTGSPRTAATARRATAAPAAADHGRLDLHGTAAVLHLARSSTALLLLAVAAIAFLLGQSVVGRRNPRLVAAPVDRHAMELEFE